MSKCIARCVMSIGCTMFVSLHSYTLCMVQDTLYLVEIAAMINHAYKKAAWVNKTVERVSVQELVGLIHDPQARLYACFDGKACVGAAVLDNSDPSHKLEMMLFTVHPEYQGKGVGKLIMDFVEQQAVQEYHAQTLYIYVVSSMQERLIAYYERHGYSLVPELDFITYNRAQRYLLHLINPEYQGTIFLYEMRKNL